MHSTHQIKLRGVDISRVFVKHILVGDVDGKHPSNNDDLVGACHYGSLTDAFE